MSQSRPVSPSSTFEAERTSLQDFAAERAHGFVGRQAVIERLIGLCQSPAEEDTPWGICVTGEPGSGKSALFGELLRRIKDTDAFVLAHAARDVRIAKQFVRQGPLAAESADLLYHLLVLLHSRGVPLHQVWSELERRER